MKSLIYIVTFILFTQNIFAQQKSSTTNYNLAAKFSTKRLEKMVFSLNVDPHWLKLSDRFWYEFETPKGKNWYIVDAIKAEKKLMFDNAKLAAEITKIVKDPFDSQHLEIDSLRFIKDENWIQFEVKSTQEIEVKDSVLVKDSTAKKAIDKPKKEKKVFYFEYNLNSGQLLELTDFKKIKKNTRWASISPDEQTIVFAKKYNLYWMDKTNYEKALKNEEDSTIVEHQLTKEGVEYFEYGNYQNETNVEKEKNKNKRKPSQIQWSPDSKYFVKTISDSRKVKDLWVVNSVAEPRPTIETYKYQMPGEKDSPLEYVYLFNIESKTKKELEIRQFKDQNVTIWSANNKVNTRDDDWRPSIWLGTNDKFYFNRTSRDLKRIDICQVNINTNTVKVLIEERMNTYVETRKLGLVNIAAELIQWSERDGWAHFYLYDSSGNLKNQITSGSFHCEDIVGIDDKKRVLYFSANGKELNEDPYYTHLYKINFDGTGLKLLNTGDYDHVARMNDNSFFFVNNFSRVNTTPTSILFNVEGKKIMDLEKADLSNLFAAGYKFPETFTVKADDGITDLYGVMYKPYNFDSSKIYPIVAYVYPGPQTEAVNKSFSVPNSRTDRLAQIGMIVITVGNRGGHPGRSKWYHNYGYGNLRDYGLADKKTTIEQLADRYTYIDINRVGIHGHSGGGFMSTAALLVYPDFFKVAVSSSGIFEHQAATSAGGLGAIGAAMARSRAGCPS